MNNAEKHFDPMDTLVEDIYKQVPVVKTKLATRPVSQAQAAYEGKSLTFRSGSRSVPAVVSSESDGLVALDFLTTLAADLSRGPVELPCFPHVVLKIRDALYDPSTSADETVKLVGTEPLLAGRLIRTANSIAFNPSGRKLTDLRTVITRLGQQAVQGAAMSFAVQQMKDEPKLRDIAGQLRELWEESIVVASISQVLVRRTKIKADEAFLAGLLHGIGRLYVMAHSAGKSAALRHELQCTDLIASWHPSIGKAVLENWKVDEIIADAVGEQDNYDRRQLRSADLTDILVVSVILARAMGKELPAEAEMAKISSFRSLALTRDECAMTMKHAEYQLASLQDALGC